MDTMMKRLAAALAMTAAVGCSQFERPTYREPDPTPVERPAPPPDRILRKAPDFRFKDYATGKTFSYRGYSETLPGGGEFRHEVITVLESGANYEREATEDERQFALETLEKDWRHKGMTEQIAYHREMARIGRERRDSLVDLRIEYAEKAAQHLEEEILVLEADLVSSTKTAGYKAPAGRLEFLQREIAAKQGELAETRSKLETLRYLHAARERAYGRSSRVTTGS